jgi:hypothetical protein
VSTTSHKWDLSAIRANFIPEADTFAYLAPYRTWPKRLSDLANVTAICGWKVGCSHRDCNRRAKEGALWEPLLLPPTHPMGLRIPGRHLELEAHILDTFHHLRLPDWEGDRREVIIYHTKVVDWMRAVRRSLHIK